MKIGVNALFMIPGEVGGTETCLRKILPCAAEAFPQDEFIIFANDENRTVLASDLRSCDNVSLVDMRVRATSRWRRALCEQFALPKALRRTGVEALWNPGNAALMYSKIPQATTIYDMQFTRFPEDFSRREHFVIRKLALDALKRSDKVFTISEFSRQEILRNTNTPFNKIEVVPSAASEIFAQRLPDAFIAERIMTLTHASDPYILCVANTYPHKSVETAVAAFGEVAGEIPHRLVLVGKPRRGEAAVAAAIAKLPDPGRVVRLQYVAETDLVALYQGADLFVLPTKYEGFGLPVIEAMTAGVPVVSTREAAVPEVGGDTIEYVHAGDSADFARAIRKVLAFDKETRSAFIERAYARSTKFTWNEAAKIIVETIKGLNVI